MKPFIVLCSLFTLLLSQHSYAATVYAAASLTQPLEILAKRYRAEHGGELKLVFAASSTLARQIASGAPADIFISANLRWMSYLEEQQWVEQPVPLLQNRLALIAPLSSELQTVELNEQLDLAALLQGSRLAVGNIDHVPVGIYAHQALVSLGLWQQVERQLAMSSNTRAALALVERHAAPLGIVYTSDARASKRVKQIAAIPAQSHQPIVYPMALVVKNPPGDQHGQGFYRYLQSEAAHALFLEFGFKDADGI